MADFPVKWFHSGMKGAPVVISDGPGTTLEALRAILITGFNLSAPDDLTYDSGTGEGVLLFTGGDHGYLLHQIIEVSGADQAEYNGQWRVTSITSTEVRYVMDAVPSANGTGTIEVKTPGAGGWTIPYEAADSLRAVFKPDNADGSDCFFFVDDRGSDVKADWGLTTTTSHFPVVIRGYRTVAGLDDRTGEFGNGILSGRYVSTSYHPTGSAVPWRCIADSRTCYLGWRAKQSSLTSNVMVAFGDLVSIRGAEHPDAFLMLQEDAAYSSPKSYFGYQAIGSSNSQKRVTTGALLGEENSRLDLLTLTRTGGATTDGLMFPNYSGELLAGSDVFARVGDVFLGVVPGLKECMSQLPLPDFSFVTLEGKLHLALNHDYLDKYEESCTFFNLEGPWQ